MQKRMLGIILCILLVFTSVRLPIFAEGNNEVSNVSANEILDDVVVDDISKDNQTVNNTNWNTYDTYSDVVRSYLVQMEKGFMQVGFVGNYNVMITYVDDNFEVIDEKTVTIELPLWGGFYAGSDNYFIVSGQNNLSEDKNLEVLRVDKYDKAWNTVSTANEMFKGEDGYHHQSCMTFEIKEDDMSVVDSHYTVSNVDCGYVSHSFNQFIMIDDNQRIVCLDHGDALNTRGAVIGYYETLAGNDHFTDTYKFYTHASIMKYQGADGDNYTGANLGGLTYSADNYLTVGRSISQDENWNKNRDWNVYVTASSKDDISKLKTVWLTSFKNGDDVYAGNPFITKFSDDLFLVVWTKYGDGSKNIQYAFIDGNAESIGQLVTVEGALSDCQPVVKGDKAVWYVESGYNKSFYSISKDGTFEKDIIKNAEKCSITLEIGENGNIYLDKGAAEMENDTTYVVNKGESLTFKIYAKNGYIIKDVLVDGKSVGAVESYTFENISEDHILKGVFGTKDEPGGNDNPGDNPSDNPGDNPADIDIPTVENMLCIVTKQKYDLKPVFEKLDIVKYKVESIEVGNSIGKASVNKSGILTAKAPGKVRIIPYKKVDGKLQEQALVDPFIITIMSPGFDITALRATYEG